MNNKDLVLITGGAGFIGSHTVDLFIKKGYRVRILDNLINHNNRWPRYVNKKALKCEGDVRNIKDWEKVLKGVKYVIHLAATMDYHLEFSNFFQTNTVGTANLYEVIVAKSLPIKKIVIASTQFVYGYGRWKCKSHGIVHTVGVSEKNKKQGQWDPICPICGREISYQKNTEDHVDPFNQYAISKYTQELIGLRLGKIHSIPTTALRYSIVHGARQSVTNLYSGALRVFALQIQNNQKILLFEDGKMLRDFVSVKDVARANYLTAIKSESNYEAYNVGGGVPYSIMELAKMIAKELNKKLKFELGSFRHGDIRHAVSDISKIAKIGWKPKINEIENIREFLTWLNLHNVSAKSVDNVFEEMKNKGILLQSKLSHN